MRKIGLYDKRKKATNMKKCGYWLEKDCDEGAPLVSLEDHIRAPPLVMMVLMVGGYDDDEEEDGGNNGRRW